MIYRSGYLKQLQKWQHHDLIKVITGIRRCGKSTLLDLFVHQLLNQGVGTDQIIRLNLENLEYLDKITDYHQLHQYVLSRITSEKRYYLLIDEIQNLEGWQKAINSLYLRKNIDIYLTGSNAYLLSGELATLLSGRYIEIRMLPLSFGELSSVPRFYQRPDAIYQYLTTAGGFPYVLSLEHAEQIDQYLRSIFDTIILKDIMGRGKFPDQQMLLSVVKFLLNNIGSLVSTHKIAATMTSSGRKISVNTVESYLTALTQAYIFYKIGRYDVRGKQYLKTGDKYYVADLGLRTSILAKNNRDQGHILENIVFLELTRRGGDIFVGKENNSEIDFVVMKNRGQIEYYQVTLSLLDPCVATRELTPLLRVPDQFAKTIITLDPCPGVNDYGIRQVNLFDWFND